MKRLFTLLVAVVMTMAMSLTAFAAGWQKNDTGWWYATNDAGTTWYANEWQWIDGNGDGIAECYDFDANGYMYANTTTPDGYTVNADGAWTENGVVQTKAAGAAGTTSQTVTQTTGDGVYINGVHHNAGYDPEHPLKNVIDQWNLRLDPATMNWKTTVSSTQIQSMLTGQTDTFIPYEQWNPAFREEARVTNEELYQWYCNWLNSWDFENASEMEKAKKIQEVLGGITYDLAYESASYGTMDYRTFIQKRAVCTGYANAAVSMAKALGLKASIIGIPSARHAIYAIMVDGTVYLGENSSLDLTWPLDGSQDSVANYVLTEGYVWQTED